MERCTNKSSNIIIIKKGNALLCVCVSLVRRGDVLAAWSGIRPLVSDPNSKDTQSISRNHVIEVSHSKMVTIAGGKLCYY